MHTSRALAHSALLTLLATGALSACSTADNAKPSEEAGAKTAFVAGEYRATGQYPTPGGLQGIGVTLTLDEKGIVTKLEVDPKAETGNSVQFQGKFASGIRAEVVGKPITELDVDKVSGSSLTSKGFNQAVAKIIEKARA